MSEFKKGFLWGGATASAQYEGGFDEGGRGLSHMDFTCFYNEEERKQFGYPIGMNYEQYTKVKQNPENYVLPNRKGADFYHRYKEDIALMAELGFKVFRMSISWTRLFPTGTEETPCPDGVQFYHNVFQECKKYGIEPMVTMIHYEVSDYLVENLNGWESPKLIEYFTHFTKFLIDEYKEEVKYWLTFNEINMVAWMPYLGGGTFVERSKRNRLSCIHQALHHQFMASALTVKYLHETAPNCMVGNMFARQQGYPYTCKPEDVLATQRENNINLFYCDVMVKGAYPQSILNYYKENDITIDYVDNYEEILKEGCVDFISFSYYMSSVISADPALAEPSGTFTRTLRNPNLEVSDWGWAIDPTGLRLTLNELHNRYHVPLFVSENGLGMMETLGEDGTVHDDYRVNYLRDHAQAMLGAIEDGCDVMGYTWWGWIDFVSCSWANIEKRYGFVYVDADDYGNGTYDRYKKESFAYLKDFIAKNGNVFD